MELASAELAPPEQSRERRLPGPRRKPEHLRDGTAGTRKRLGTTALAPPTAAGARGAARQGSRGTQRALQPGAPGGAEPLPPERATGRAAREVSGARCWGAAGQGGRGARVLGLPGQLSGEEKEVCVWLMCSPYAWTGQS